MRRSALEHHVLQQMSHPGFTIVFLPGADQVGDVHGYSLLGLIGKKEDAQSVFKPVLSDALRRGELLYARRQLEGCLVVYCGDLNEAASTSGICGIWN